MSLPAIFRPRVGRDLADAYGWYEEQRPGLGGEFLMFIDASFDSIERFPAMFALVHGEVRRAIVSGFPYAVFYRVEEKRLVVLAVLHTAMNPKSWPRPRNKSR